MTPTSSESLEQVRGSAQSNAQEECLEKSGEKHRKMQHCGVEQKASLIVSILLFHHSLVSENHKAFLLAFCVLLPPLPLYLPPHAPP